MVEKIELTARLVAERLLHDIAQGESSALVLTVIIAVIADGYGVTPLAHIPLLGAIPQWFAILIITAMLWNVGGLIKWKVRGVIWFAGLLESVPLIALLPLNTTAVIIAVIIIKSRARAASEELEEMKRALPRSLTKNKDFQKFLTQEAYRRV